MRYALGEKVPKIGEGVFIAPNAAVIGEVTIADGASVWFGVVMRGDVDSITVGRGSNTEGKEFPPGSVIMGRPARVVRSVSEADLERIHQGGPGYRLNAERFKPGLQLDVAVDTR